MKHTEPHKARILIALGMDQRAIVMTTDSSWVGADVENVGSAYCDDLGILDPKDYHRAAGVYLWDGVLTTEVDQSPDGYEPYTGYKGEVRACEPHELAALLAMKPPIECVVCGSPATGKYPDEDGEPSCGLPSCEIQMQFGIDGHAACGDR